jgi:hypothetical protein
MRVSRWARRPAPPSPTVPSRGCRTRRPPPGSSNSPGWRRPTEGRRAGNHQGDPYLGREQFDWLDGQLGDVTSSCPSSPNRPPSGRPERTDGRAVGAKVNGFGSCRPWHRAPPTWSSSPATSTGSTRSTCSTSPSSRSPAGPSWADPSCGHALGPHDAVRRWTTADAESPARTGPGTSRGSSVPASDRRPDRGRPPRRSRVRGCHSPDHGAALRPAPRRPGRAPQRVP